jgi:hypothetical protein
MQLKKKNRLYVVLILLAVLLLVPGWFGYKLGIIPRVDRIETFHSPLFGSDGGDVYYLTRNAWGVSWGPGIEFFTPPAAIIVLRDRFLLQRTSRETGTTTTIRTWRVPHQLKPKTHYRNYLFGVPDCELKWEGKTLHYKIGLDFLPNEPPYLTVNEWAIGSWSADTNTIAGLETWKSGYHSTDRWSEQVLAGPFEIIDYKSQALILLDSDTQTRRPIRVSRSGGADLGAEILTADLTDYIHRAQLERSRTIRETYAETVAGLRSQGLSEGEAMLQANDEMENKGYYPKTPKLVAAKTNAAPQGIRVFEITNDEFRFGMFQDIEEALAQPGTEVHFHGKYITHRDFDTSRKLNEHLDAGNRTFIVKRDNELFLLTIQ